MDHHRELQFCSRYEFVWSPFPDPEDSILVRPPYSPGPHDGEVPERDEALGIAGRKSLIVSEKDSSVGLCLVSAEDCPGDWSGFSHGRVAAAFVGSCCRLSRR